MDYWSMAFWGIVAMAVLHYGGRIVALFQVYWIEWKFERHLAEWDFAKTISGMKLAGWYHENPWFNWSVIICFIWVIGCFILGCIYSPGL